MPGQVDGVGSLAALKLLHMSLLVSFLWRVLVFSVQKSFYQQVEKKHRRITSDHCQSLCVSADSEQHVNLPRPLMFEALNCMYIFAWLLTLKQIIRTGTGSENFDEIWDVNS